MRGRPVLVSVALLLVYAATAMADPLPSVKLPSVQLPAVPTVAPPALPKVPLPVPTVRLPVPVPVPVPSAVPVAPAPAPAPAPSVPRVTHSAPVHVGGGSSAAPSVPAVSGTSAAAAPAAPASSGTAGAVRTTSGGPAAGSSARTYRRADAAERRRHSRKLRRTVLRLAGCLDALPRVERRVLILRAAPQRERPRSRRAVARRLDTDAQRVAVIERRGVHRLHRLDRTTSCQGSPAPFATGSGGSGGAVLADYGGLPAGGAGTGTSTGGTSAAESGSGGSSGGASPGGSSAGGSSSSGGNHSSSGGVKGESRSHPDQGIFPGVSIGPKPGSRDWLLLVGIVLGAALVFLGRALLDRRKRRRRNAAYY